MVAKDENLRCVAISYVHLSAIYLEQSIDLVDLFWTDDRFRFSVPHFSMI